MTGPPCTVADGEVAAPGPTPQPSPLPALLAGPVLIAHVAAALPDCAQ